MICGVQMECKPACAFSRQIRGKPKEMQPIMAIDITHVESLLLN